MIAGITAWVEEFQLIVFKVLISAYVHSNVEGIVHVLNSSIGKFMYSISKSRKNFLWYAK